MNEYRVTISTHDGERAMIIEAETAALAHRQAEDETGADVASVKFVRALSFSCRMRGPSPRG